MQRKFLHVALAFASAWAAPATAGAQPAENHPLVGKWTWTRSANQCTEVYEFRPDGTALVTSGDERTDNVYTVAPKPDARGFYKLELRVTKDHGGKDCADLERDDTGQRNVNHVRFEADGRSHLWCRKPNLETCFGPLKRMP